MPFCDDAPYDDVFPHLQDFITDILQTAILKLLLGFFKVLTDKTFQFSQHQQTYTENKTFQENINS